MISLRNRSTNNLEKGSNIDEANVPIKILNWNIRNPCIGRAKQQTDWILQIDADIVILTEAKYSQGCLFLCSWLESYGFKVFFPRPADKDYCVIVAIKGFVGQKVELHANFLAHRVVSVMCETQVGKVRIVGLYVPSRGAKEKRNVDKRKFQQQIMDVLGCDLRAKRESSLIIAGDLNVLERDHVPHYPVFGEWEYAFYESFIKYGLVDAYRLVHPDTQEYSWFGRKGCGYRFDHFFISEELMQYIIDCSYVHSARNLGLSDHSGMVLVIALTM